MASIKSRLAWKLGYELSRIAKGSSAHALRAQLIAYAKPTLILDVGGNEGQFGQSIISHARGARIVSYEPVGEAHRKLSGAARRHPNWSVAPRMAVGGDKSVARINVSQFTQASSLLPMSKAHLDEVKESIYVGTEEVPVEPLDEAALAYLKPDDRIYLKVDTQGFEKQVLAGAKNLMPQIAALEIELSYVQLYEGSPLAAEMISLVTNLGFSPFAFSNEMRNKKTGELMAGDGYFIRV